MASIFESNGSVFKFVNEGDNVTGELVEFREEQQHEFDRITQKPSEKLATYDNGDPIMQLVLVLDTDILDDDEDDGRRVVFISSARAKKAVVQAVRAAGVKVPEPGGRFSITYTGKDPKSFNASAKTFSAEYRKPDVKSAVFGTGGVKTEPAEHPWKPAASASTLQKLSAETVEKIRNLKTMGLASDVIVNALASENVTAADVAAA